MPCHRILSSLAWASLALAFASAAFMALDIATGRRQPMKVMEIVWPVTGLYMGPLGLLFYLWFGRARRDGGTGPPKPFWQSVFLSASHCGGGCTLGDIFSEGTLYFVGGRIAGSALLTSYVGDFSVAYVLGIWFQYLPIRAARRIARQDAVVAAIKADTLSLCAFEAGLFAWMALVQRAWFTSGLKADEPVFWFMMQLGMCAGFLTTYPANRWLVRRGIKEGM